MRIGDVLKEHKAAKHNEKYLKRGQIALDSLINGMISEGEYVLECECILLAQEQDKINQRRIKIGKIATGGVKSMVKTTVNSVFTIS